jgi:putative PIN family toxin of toxin-antitoxin system
VLRIVLDPGVLISALISGSGSPARLVLRWQEGLFDLVVSPMLLNELAGALRREKFRSYVTQTEALRFVVWLRHSAELVEDPPAERGLTPDPGDDYLVTLSRAASADFIVSGDRHLAGIRRPRPPVLSPKQLLDRLSRLS